MSQVIRVGVDFSERSLRYAILRRSNAGSRLLKLGRVDFAFDLARALSTEDAGAQRDVVTRALADVVARVRPTTLRVALHSPLGRSFFSRARSGEDPSAQARFESELLGYCAGDDDSVVSTDVVWSDREVDRLHVSVTRGVVLEMLGRVIEPLGCGEAVPVSAPRAAAEVFRRLPWATHLAASRVLAVGRFDHVDEVLVLDVRGWRFGIRVPVEPAAERWFGASVLVEAGEGSIDSVLTYGEPCVHGWIADMRGTGTSGLDGLTLVGHDRTGLRPEEWPGRFAAAIGAAMLP